MSSLEITPDYTALAHIKIEIIVVSLLAINFVHLFYELAITQQCQS